MRTRGDRMCREFDRERNHTGMNRGNQCCTRYYFRTVSCERGNVFILPRAEHSAVHNAERVGSEAVRDPAHLRSRQVGWACIGGRGNGMSKSLVVDRHKQGSVCEPVLF